MSTTASTPSRRTGDSPTLPASSQETPPCLTSSEAPRQAQAHSQPVSAILPTRLSLDKLSHSRLPQPVEPRPTITTGLLAMEHQAKEQLLPIRTRRLALTTWCLQSQIRTVPRRRPLNKSRFQTHQAHCRR